MDIQPHRPQGGMNPGRPNPGAPRPLVSDFAPRRSASPQPLAPRPIPVPGPPAAPVKPPQNSGSVLAPPPRPQAITPQPPAPKPTPAAAPQPRITDTLPDMPAPKPELDDEPKTPGRRVHFNYAALIGFGVFVVLAILFVSPLIPGKVLDNFPGSSATASSGEQSLACIDDVKNMTSSTTYTTKRGSPLVYTYATTTTLKGTCDGVAQTAVGGTTSLFSPLALILNLVLAAVAGFAVAKLCGKFFFKPQA